MDSIEMKTACITGATSGIGAAFARRFAKKGYDLVITGRRKDKIESLSHTLSTEHHVHVKVIVAELSDEKELDGLTEIIKEAGNLEILVNNAGFAKKNIFYKESFLTHETMLKVHNLAMMKLCHAVLPGMVAKGKGAIINVSSLIALTPFPMNAMYSASKSLIKLFTEALYIELRETGVKIQALCPGMTRTDFHKRMGIDEKMIYKDRGIMKAMTPEKVVDISLKYLEKDKVLCVPGWNNKISSFLLKVLPQAAISRIGYIGDSK